MRKRNNNQTNQRDETSIATAKKIEVAFILEDAEANEVYLSGDFNDWSASNIPMIRREAGQWEKRIFLTPGRYEYKFIIDGKWTPDPYASQEVANAFGSTNSVAEVR